MCKTYVYLEQMGPNFQDKVIIFYVHSDQAANITEADKLMEQFTGKNPMKPGISVQILKRTPRSGLVQG